MARRRIELFACALLVATACHSASDAANGGAASVDGATSEDANVPISCANAATLDDACCGPYGYGRYAATSSGIACPADLESLSLCQFVEGIGVSDECGGYRAAVWRYVDTPPNVLLFDATTGKLAADLEVDSISQTMSCASAADPSLVLPGGCGAVWMAPRACAPRSGHFTSYCSTRPQGDPPCDFTRTSASICPQPLGCLFDADAGCAASGRCVEPPESEGESCTWTTQCRCDGSGAVYVCDGLALAPSDGARCDPPDASWGDSGCPSGCVAEPPSPDLPDPCPSGLRCDCFAPPFTMPSGCVDLGIDGDSYVNGGRLGNLVESLCCRIADGG